MHSYLITKIGRFILTLFLVSIIVFSMIHLIPGDPVVVLLGRYATPENVKILRHEMGLDLPLHVQYVKWVTSVIRGDMGNSLRLQIPVIDMVLERYPRTLSIVLLGSLVSLLISFGAGIFSARNPNSWKDLIVTTGSLLGISLPSFWLAILLVIVFSVKLGFLPSSGYVPLCQSFWGWLSHVLMPGITLGLGVGAIMTRIVRGSFLEVFGSNFVMVANAKGLTEKRVLYFHCLKNASLPIVTYFGMELGYMLGGSVLIERIFMFPGLGQLTIDAILQRDYPLIQAVILAFALTFVTVNFIVDIMYAILDPRIRLGKTHKRV